MTQKSNVGCIGNRKTIDGKRYLANGFVIDESMTQEHSDNDDDYLFDEEALIRER